MRSKTVVQLILFITSLVIIFTYIRPSYTNLQAIQEDTKMYDDALESAKNFNTELRNQLSEANRISTAQLQKLDRYLPSEIDTVAVMRDIDIITKRNNLQVLSLNADESSSENSASANTEYLDDESGDAAINTGKVPGTSVSFKVDVEGSYDDFKKFLQDLERNAYPLEIVNMGLTTGSASNDNQVANADNYKYSLTLKTYKLVNNIE